MQVNHILNILISSGAEGEGGRKRREEFVPHISWHAWVPENRKLG